MKVLVIVQVDPYPLGHLGAAANHLSWDLDVFTVVPAHRFSNPDVTVKWPLTHKYSAIIALGAPWSICAPGLTRHWVEEQQELMRTATNQGIPILGICFGAQLLANALGGGVEVAPEEEIGWCKVKSDNDIFAREWFQMHHDRVIAPLGSEILATSPVSIQAFSVGTNLGVQFHPEVNDAVLSAWFSNLKDDIEKSKKLISEARLRSENDLLATIDLLKFFQYNYILR